MKAAQEIQSEVRGGVQEMLRRTLEDMSELCKAFRTKEQMRDIVGYDDALAKLYYDMAVVGYRYYMDEGGMDNLSCIRRLLKKGIQLYTVQIKTLSSKSRSMDLRSRIQGLNIIKQSKVFLGIINKHNTLLKDKIKSLESDLQSELSNSLFTFKSFKEMVGLAPLDPSLKAILDCCKLTDISLRLGDLERATHYLKILKEITNNQFSEEIKVFELRIQDIERMNQIIDLELQLVLPIQDDIETILIKKPNSKEEFNHLMEEWNLAKEQKADEEQSSLNKLLIVHQTDLSDPSSLGWEAWLQTSNNRGNLIYKINSQSNFAKFLDKCHGNYKALNIGGELIELLFSQGVCEPLSDLNSFNSIQSSTLFKSKRQKVYALCHDLSECYAALGHVPLSLFYAKSHQYFKSQQEKFAIEFYSLMGIEGAIQPPLGAEKLESKQDKELTTNLADQFFPLISPMGASKLNDPISLNEFLNKILPFIDQIPDIIGALTVVEKLEWRHCPTAEMLNQCRHQWLVEYQKFKIAFPLIKKYLLLFEASTKQWYFYGEMQHERIVEGYLNQDKTHKIKQLLDILTDSALKSNDEQRILAKLRELYVGTDNYSGAKAAQEWQFLKKQSPLGYKKNYDANTGILIYHFNDKREWKMLRNRITSQATLLFACLLKIPKHGYITLLIDKRQAKSNQGPATLYVIDPSRNPPSNIQNIVQWLKSIDVGCRYEVVDIPCPKQSGLSNDSLLHSYLNAQAALHCMEINQWPFFQENLCVQKFSSADNVERIKRAYIDALNSLPKQEEELKSISETHNLKLLDRFRQQFSELVQSQFSALNPAELALKVDGLNKSIGSLQEYVQLINFIEQTPVSSKSSKAENEKINRFKDTAKELAKTSASDPDPMLELPNLIQIMLNTIQQAANQLLDYQEKVTKKFEHFERVLHDYLVLSCVNEKPLENTVAFSHFVRTVNQRKETLLKSVDSIGEAQKVIAQYSDFLRVLIKDIDENKRRSGSGEIIREAQALISLMETDKGSKASTLLALLKPHVAELSKFSLRLSQVEESLESFITLLDTLIRHNVELLKLPEVHSHLRKITFEVIGGYQPSFEDLKICLTKLAEYAQPDVGLGSLLNKEESIKKIQSLMAPFEQCLQNKDMFAVHQISAYLRSYIALKQDHYLDSMALFRHRTLSLMESFEPLLHQTLINSLKLAIKKKNQELIATPALALLEVKLETIQSKLQYFTVYREIVHSLKNKALSFPTHLLDDMLKQLNDPRHSHYSYALLKLEDLRKMLVRFSGLEGILPSLSSLFYAFLIERYDALPETIVLAKGKGIHRDIYEKLNQAVGFSDLQAIVKPSNDSKMAQLIEKCLVFVKDGDRKASAEISACLRQCLVDTAKEYSDSLSLFRHRTVTTLNTFEKNLYETFSTYEYSGNFDLREKLTPFLKKLQDTLSEERYETIFSVYLSTLFFLQNQGICKNEITQFSNLIKQAHHSIKPHIQERCQRLANVLSSYIEWYEPVQQFESNKQFIFEIHLDSAIRLSDVVKKLKEFQGLKLTPGNEIRIISSAPIYTDINLNTAEYSGVCISLISPELRSVPSKPDPFTINTNGKKADPWEQVVAHNGAAGGSNQAGGNGSNGYDGKDGHNAGHVYIVCENMPSAVITAVGGEGANAQAGGNGGAGGNGKNGASHDFQKKKDEFKDYAGGWYSRSFLGYAMGSDGEPGGLGGAAGTSGYGGEGGFKGKIEVSCFKNEDQNKSQAEIKQLSEDGKRGDNGKYAKAGVAGDPGEDGLDYIFWSNSVGFLGSRNHEGVKGRVTDRGYAHLRGTQCGLGQASNQQQEKRVFYGSDVTLPAYYDEAQSRIIFQNKRERLKNRTNQEGRLVSHKHDGYAPHLRFNAINKHHVFKQTKSAFDSILKSAKTGGFQHWRANALNGFLEKMAASQQLPYHKVDNLPEVDLEAQQILALQEQFEDLHHQVNQRLESQLIDTQELSIGTTVMAAELLSQHQEFKAESEQQQRNLQSEIDSVNVAELSRGLELRSNEIANARHQINQAINAERDHQRQIQQVRTQALVEMTRSEKIKLRVDDQTLKVDPKSVLELKPWKPFKNTLFSDPTLVQRYNLFNATSMTECLFLLVEEFVSCLAKQGRSGVKLLKKQEASEFIYIFMYNLTKSKLTLPWLTRLNALINTLLAYQENQKKSNSVIEPELLEALQAFSQKLSLEHQRQYAYQKIEMTLQFCKSCTQYELGNLSAIEQQCRTFKKQLGIQDPNLLAKIIYQLNSSEQVLKLFSEVPLSTQDFYKSIELLNPRLKPLLEAFNLQPTADMFVKLIGEISESALFKSKQEKLYQRLAVDKSNANVLIHLFTIVHHNHAMIQGIPFYQGDLCKLKSHLTAIESGILRYPFTAVSQTILKRQGLDTVKGGSVFEYATLEQALQLFQTLTEPTAAVDILRRMISLDPQVLSTTKGIEEFFEWIVNHHDLLNDSLTPIFNHLQMLYFKNQKTNPLDKRSDTLLDSMAFTYGLFDAKQSLVTLRQTSKLVNDKDACIMVDRINDIIGKFDRWLENQSNIDQETKNTTLELAFLLYNFIGSIGEQGLFWLDNPREGLFHGLLQAIDRLSKVLDQNGLWNKLYQHLNELQKQNQDQEREALLKGCQDRNVVLNTLHRGLNTLTLQAQSLYRQRACETMLRLGVFSDRLNSLPKHYIARALISLYQKQRSFADLNLKNVDDIESLFYFSLFLKIRCSLPEAVANALDSEWNFKQWRESLTLFSKESTLEQKDKLFLFLQAALDPLNVCEGVNDGRLKSIMRDSILPSIKTPSNLDNILGLQHGIYLGILGAYNKDLVLQSRKENFEKKADLEKQRLEVQLYKSMIPLVTQNRYAHPMMKEVIGALIEFFASIKNPLMSDLYTLDALLKLCLNLNESGGKNRLNWLDPLSKENYLSLLTLVLKDYKNQSIQLSTIECLNNVIPFAVEKINFRDYQTISLKPQDIETLVNLRASKVFTKDTKDSVLKLVDRIESNVKWAHLYQFMRTLFTMFDEVTWIDLAFMDESLLQANRELLLTELTVTEAKNLGEKVETIKNILWRSFQSAQEAQQTDLISMLKILPIKDEPGKEKEKEKSDQQAQAERQAFIKESLQKIAVFDGYCGNPSVEKRDVLTLSYTLKLTKFLTLLNHRLRRDEGIEIDRQEWFKILEVLNCFENLSFAMLALKEVKLSDWLKVALVEHILEKHRLIFKEHSALSNAELKYKLMQINPKTLLLLNNVFVTEYADQIRQKVYHDLADRPIMNHQKLSDAKFIGIVDDLRKIEADPKLLDQLAGLSLTIWDLTLYEYRFNQTFNKKIASLNRFKRNELEQALLYLNRIRVGLGIDKRPLFRTFFKAIWHALSLSNATQLTPLTLLLQSINRQEISFMAGLRIVSNAPFEAYRGRLQEEIKVALKEARKGEDASIEALITSIITEQNTNTKANQESVSFSKEAMLKIKQEAIQFKDKMKDYHFAAGNEAASIKGLLQDIRNTKEYQDDPEGYVYAHLNSIVPLLLYAWSIANASANKPQIPRNTQLLALMFFINNGDQGLLQQIRTGEGKTLTVGLISAFKVLCGYSVDVVSSNRDLAIVGEAKCRSFYQLLNITSGHNCDNNDEANHQAYANSIVYGEVGGFQRDILEEEFNGKDIFKGRYKTKAGPRKKCLIVDEVDNMCLDKARHVLYLSHEIESLKWLESVFINIWIATLRAEVKEQEDIDKHIIDISTFIVDRIKSREIELPPYLMGYVNYKIKRWCDSAFQARFMRENDQFVVDVSKEDGQQPGSKQKNIIALDKDTGVELYSTRWSEGLAQFLELKYRRKISVESLKAVFISNKKFFQRYGKDLLGLTGTLGSESSRSFLADMYKIRSIDMPTSRIKRYLQHESRVTDEYNGWLDLLAEQTVLEAQRRPVLIICENVDHAVSLREELVKNKNVPVNKISSYIRDGDNIEEKFKQAPATLGDIIIATNKGGRGTDIEVSKEANENGGLHVILSYLPDNVRIEEQAFGRTSRNGNPGSGQFILCIDPAPFEENYKLKDLDSKTRHDKLLELSEIIVEREKVNRDTRESLRLSQLKQKNILHLEVEEELFDHFNQLKVTLSETIFKKMFTDARFKYLHERVIEVFENILKNRWGFWLDEAKEAIEKIENAAQKMGLIDKFKLEFASPIQQACRSGDFLKIVNLFIQIPEDAVQLGMIFVPKHKDEIETDIKKIFLKFAEHCFKRALELEDITGFPNIALTYCMIFLKEQDGKIIKKLARRELKKALFKLESMKRNLMANLEIVRLLPKMAAPEIQQKIAAKENFYQEQIAGKLEVIGLQIHHIKNSIGDYAEAFDFTSASNPSEQDLKTSRDIYDRLIKENILVGDRLRKMYRRDPQALKQILSRQLDPSIAEPIATLLTSNLNFDKTKLEALVCSGQELWEVLGLDKNEEPVYILDNDRISKELESRFEDIWKKVKERNINASNVDLTLFKEPKEDEKALAEFQEYLTSKKMLVKTKKIHLDKMVLAVHQLETSKKVAEDAKLAKYHRLVFNSGGNESKTLKDFLLELTKNIETHRSLVRGGKYFYVKDLPFGEAAEEAAKVYAFLKEKYILKSGGLEGQYKYKGDFKSDLKELLEKKLGGDFKDMKEMIKNKLTPLQGDIRSWDNDIKASLKMFMELEGQEKIPGELPFFKGLGLDKFLVIQEDKSWWDWGAFAVFLIGLVQVVAGAILCVFGLVNIGNALISEGINDMVYSVMAWATGTFSWKEWGIQKAISFSISLLTAGISTLASIGKTAAKLGSVSIMSVLAKVAWQAVKEFAITFVTNLVTNTVVEEIRKNIVEKVIKGILEKILNEVTSSIREGLKKIYRESGAAQLVGILKQFYDAILRAFNNAQQIFEKFEELRSQVVTSIENNFSSLISGLKNSSSAIVKAAGTVLDVVKIVNDIWKVVQTATKSIDTISAFIKSIGDCIKLLQNNVDVKEATALGESEVYKLIDDKVNELSGKVNEFISEKLIKQLDALLKQAVNGTLGALCRSMVQTNRDKMDAQLKNSNLSQRQGLNLEDEHAQKIRSKISESIANAPKSLAERNEQSRKALLSSVQDLKQLSGKISVGVDFGPIQKVGEDIGKGVQSIQTTINNVGRDFNISSIRASIDNVSNHFKTLQDNAKDMTTTTRATLENTKKTLESQLKQAETAYRDLQAKYKDTIQQHWNQINKRVQELTTNCQALQAMKPLLDKSSLDPALEKINLLKSTVTGMKDFKNTELMVFNVRDALMNRLTMMKHGQGIYGQVGCLQALNLLQGILLKKKNEVESFVLKANKNQVTQILRDLNGYAKQAEEHYKQQFEQIAKLNLNVADKLFKPLAVKQSFVKEYKTRVLKLKQALAELQAVSKNVRELCNAQAFKEEWLEKLKDVKLNVESEFKKLPAQLEQVRSMFNEDTMETMEGYHKQLKATIETMESNFKQQQSNLKETLEKIPKKLQTLNKALTDFALQDNVLMIESTQAHFVALLNFQSKFSLEIPFFSDSKRKEEFKQRMERCRSKLNQLQDQVPLLINESSRKEFLQGISQMQLQLQKAKGSVDRDLTNKINTMTQAMDQLEKRAHAFVLNIAKDEQNKMLEAVETLTKVVPAITTIQSDLTQQASGLLNQSTTQLVSQADKLKSMLDKLSNEVHKEELTLACKDLKDRTTALVNQLKTLPGESSKDLIQTLQNSLKAFESKVKPQQFEQFYTDAKQQLSDLTNAYQEQRREIHKIIDLQLEKFAQVQKVGLFNADLKSIEKNALSIGAKMNDSLAEAQAVANALFQPIEKGMDEVKDKFDLLEQNVQALRSFAETQPSLKPMLTGLKLDVNFLTNLSTNDVLVYQPVEFVKTPAQDILSICKQINQDCLQAVLPKFQNHQQFISLKTNINSIATQAQRLQNFYNEFSKKCGLKQCSELQTALNHVDEACRGMYEKISGVFNQDPLSEFYTAFELEKNKVKESYARYWTQAMDTAKPIRSSLSQWVGHLETDLQRINQFTELSELDKHRSSFIEEFAKLERMGIDLLGEKEKLNDLALVKSFENAVQTLEQGKQYCAQLFNQCVSSKNDELLGLNKKLNEYHQQLLGFIRKSKFEDVERFIQEKTDALTGQCERFQSDLKAKLDQEFAPVKANFDKLQNFTDTVAQGLSPNNVEMFGLNLKKRSEALIQQCVDLDQFKELQKELQIKL